jgi:hypothetical protein
VEELVRLELAVEDVAADETELLLEIVRTEDLSRDHGRLEVGRLVVVAVDDPVGVRVQLRPGVARRPSSPARTG